MKLEIKGRRDMVRATWVGVCSAAFAASAWTATIPVTTTADDLAVNGNCTLREAVQAAQTDLAVDACPAGGLAQADLVEVPGDHTLTLGEIVVTAGSGPLILRGLSPASTIRGLIATPSRLLSLQEDTDVTLEALVLRVGSHDSSGGAIRAGQADLVARDVTFTFNFAPLGGALSYFASGGHRLVLEHCRFAGNQAGSAMGDALGGGARISINSGATARIVDSNFEGNEAVAEPGADNATGGGLYAIVGAGSSVELVRSTFTLNRVDPQPAGGGEGSGAYLSANGSGARLIVVDSVFLANNVVQPSATEFTGALRTFVSDGAALVLDRVRLENNDVGEPGRHLVLMTLGTATLSATNLLLANGPATGLSVDCADGNCRVGHTTIAGHASRAAFLTAAGAGELRLENSILFAGHSVSVVGPVVVDASNLGGGTNPEFVNAAAGDYRLAANSPAIDFGDATLDSVGPYDAAHAPRVAGGDTDAGAFEFGSLFGDGFASADAGAWSGVLP